MELYNVFCIALAILVVFSVGESILKNLGINRYLLLLFLLFSLLTSILPQIQLISINISINFGLYFITFLIYLFKLKSFKECLKSCLISIVSFTLMVCFNSLNLLQYEFAYFQPYLIVCVILSIFCVATTRKFSTSYCGLFIGITLSEMIRSNNNQIFSIYNKFCLGDMKFSNLIAISLFLFSILLFVVNFTKKRIQNRQTKKLAKQQNM